MNMNQHDQELDLIAAQACISAPIVRVDRCRHESIDYTCLLLFNAKGQQIGSVQHMSTSPGFHNWQVSHMSNGLPTTQRNFVTLKECVDHVVEREARNA